MRIRLPRTSAGFTLIELLVVIGIIALLAGMVGLGLNSGNEAKALRSARGLVAAQFAAARAQALLRGTSTALAVAADPADPANYLRQIAVAISTDGTTWVAAQDALSLPAGLRLQPPRGGSTLLAVDPVPVAMEPDPAAPTTPCFLVIFSATGTLQVAGGGNLQLGFGQVTGGGWGFDPTRESARLEVSRYGALTEVAP